MKTVFVKGMPNDLKQATEALKKSVDGFGGYSQSLTFTTGYCKELHQQLKKLAVKKSRFERFYDSVSSFIGGGKSFLPKELKSF